MHNKLAHNRTSTSRFFAVLVNIALACSIAMPGRCESHSTPEGASHPSFKVEVHGQGQPMILIPGYASSGEVWKSTVAHFQGRYACHVLTLAGFAGAPPIATPLFATVRSELADYIRQQRLNKPVLVGHSLGGSLALDLAAQNPALVGSVVIVDTLPFMAGAAMQAKTLEEAKPGIENMRRYLSGRSREQYEQGVRSALGFKFMVTAADDLEMLKRWGLSTDMKTAAEAMPELFSLDLRPGLSRITSSALVLGTWIGLQEQLKNIVDLRKEDFVETFRGQYANLPNMHFVMSDKARHFIMLDDPQWFFQQLDAFLANPSEAVKDRGFEGKVALNRTPSGN